MSIWNTFSDSKRWLNAKVETSLSQRLYIHPDEGANDKTREQDKQVQMQASCDRTNDVEMWLRTLVYYHKEVEIERKNLTKTNKTKKT